MPEDLTMENLQQAATTNPGAARETISLNSKTAAVYDYMTEYLAKNHQFFQYIS